MTPALECRLEEAVLEALLCDLLEINIIDVDHSDEVVTVGLLGGP